MTQPDGLVISFEKLSLGSLCKVGFRSGTLTKQGAIVKNWKERYFSLTWNYLSYYEPQEPKIRIASIPLSSCLKVLPGTEENKPYSFQLYCKDRTFSFLSQSKIDRERWIEAIEAMIHTSNPKVFPETIYNLSNSGATTNPADLVRKIAFHVLKIITGTTILLNTNQNLREKSQLMCSALFSLIKSFALHTLEQDKILQNKHYADLLKYSSDLNNSVLLIKKGIPPEHRILSEEPTFDIGWEERRIRVHLKTLSFINEPEEDRRRPFFLEEIEEDVKPYVLEVIRELLV